MSNSAEGATKCVSAGEADPDIAGIGTIAAFAFQTSLFLLLTILNGIGLPVLRFIAGCFCGSGDEPEIEPFNKKLELTAGVVLSGSTYQAILGMSLIIIAFMKMETISLYHLEVIFYLASCTVISQIAYEACRRGRTTYQGDPYVKGLRWIVSIALFGLYISFSVMHTIKLKAWNVKEPGKCFVNLYDTGTAPGKDPGSTIRLFMWICLAFIATAIFTLPIVCRGRVKKYNKYQAGGYPELGYQHNYHERLRLRRDVIIDKVLGYLYPLLTLPAFFLALRALVDLRKANKPILEDGDEDELGYGQLVSIFLAAMNLVELFVAFREYRSWKQG